MPVFSGIAASAPVPDAVAEAIMPHRASLYELGKITTYYRIDRNNRVLMGGRSRQTEISGADQLAFLVNYAKRLWPQIADVAWTHGWSGQLAITPDHYPHIHEPAPGVLVCVAYNGRGVAMSTAMGPQLAKRTLGGATAQIDMPITDLRKSPSMAYGNPPSPHACCMGASATTCTSKREFTLLNGVAGVQRVR